MSPPLFGVDFSGAKAADRAIWIAEGERVGNRVAVRRLTNARERFGVRTGRDAHQALAALIAGSGAGALFAIDVPFALPAPLNPANWRDFVSSYAERFADAEAMRAWATAEALRLAGARELKRETDREAKTPFAAYNLRLYRQTDAAIRAVAAPLLGRADFPPMEPVGGGRPVVIEACPASALKARGLYHPYKGDPRSEVLRAARSSVLDDLAGRLDLPDAVRRAALDNPGGDALDALLCLDISARADPAQFTPRSDVEQREGRVYF
ncbi:MAG: hypothetical protein AAFR11_11755 [Pseudomonadota bacterium]